MPGSSHDSQTRSVESSRPPVAQLELLTWASFVVGKIGQVPARHHRLLLEQLDRISRGDIDRLMVLMPPGSAKSTYAHVNSDFWGVYAPTPASAGTWYAWVAGPDGSMPTVYPTPFTVT